MHSAARAAAPGHARADRPLAAAQPTASALRQRDACASRARDAAAMAERSTWRLDQVDVADRLDAHLADQLALDLAAPERDAGRDLASSSPRPCTLVPAIGRISLVRLGGRRWRGSPLPRLATGPDRALAISLARTNVNCSARDVRAALRRQRRDAGSRRMGRTSIECRTSALSGGAMPQRDRRAGARLARCRSRGRARSLSAALRNARSAQSLSEARSST